MNLQRHARAAMLLLAPALLLTMGCATRRYDAYGNPYYDHNHAAEGAVVGGLAGAGVGAAVAGPYHDEAGLLIGGVLGALTGAVVGDAIDRQEAETYPPPPLRYPDGPPPPRDPYPDRSDPYPDRYERDHDRWDDRGPGADGYGDDYEDDYGYRREPEPEPEPRFLRLPDEVLFAEGSARLESGAKRRLRTVATALRRHPGTRAVIRGHASRVEDRSPALSEARARAVREYLLHEGVAPSRVTALGMGARFPLTSDRTPEGRQRNRRAEIEIHSERGRELARLW